MPGLANSCVYYARQTREVYQVDLLSGFQSSRGVWIHWVRQYFDNVALFGIKGLQTSEMTVKLKVNSFPNFWHCIYHNVWDKNTYQ